MTELRQSPAYCLYLSQVGWVVETSAQGIRAYVKYLPLLPFGFMKIQRVGYEDLDFNWIKEISRKHRVILAYIELVEAAEAMKLCGFSATNTVFLPGKTRIINLHKPVKQLLSEMKAKTRYNISVAKKHKLPTKTVSGTQLTNNAEGMDDLVGLLADNSKRKGYFGLSKKELYAQFKAFGEEALVVLVYNRENVLLAGTIFLVAGETAYYSHNGSTKEGRRLMAPTLAVWGGITEAKKRGLGFLDFDGVFDERFPQKRWRGFTRFKEGFGGEVIYYPAAYRKWFPGR